MNSEFLADENCDFAVVRALRTAGHDVLTISETNPGAEDSVVIELATDQDRILLTEDKDFGQLTYASSPKGLGVILLRYPSAARSKIGNDIIQFVRKHEAKLKGTFVVIQRSRKIYKNEVKMKLAWIHSFRTHCINPIPELLTIFQQNVFVNPSRE